MDKKHLQLGMHPATASQRLVKDLLFKLAINAGYKCHHCGQDLIRETFSIEHKMPWLDSSDPKALFFDLDNVHFSHLICNVRAARKPNKLQFDTETERLAYIRRQNATKERRLYTPERRRRKFERTGY